MINLEQFKLDPQEQQKKLRQVPLDQFKTKSPTKEESKKTLTNSGIGGFATGIAQGVSSLPFRAMELGKNLAYGVGKVAQNIPIAPIQEYGKKVTDYQEQEKSPNWLKSITEVPEALQPKTTSQKAGYATENIAEFLMPTGMAAKATTAATKGLTKIMPSMMSKAPEISTKLDKVIQGVSKLGARSIAEGTEFAAKQSLQTPEDFNKVKEAGMIGLITPTAIKGITTAAKKVAPVTASVLAEMIGKEPEHIIRAFKNPEIVAKRMSEKVIPYQVREKAIKSLNNYRSTFLKDFDVGLEAIQKTAKSKNIAPKVKSIVQDTTAGIPYIFRKMKVSVSKNGILDFDKLNSSIVSSSEKSNMQKVFNTIKNQTDFSPKGMQAVASRINALTKFTEGNRNISSKIISDIHNLYSNAIKKTYPELSQLRNSYSASTQIYKGIDDILKSVKNNVASPTASTTATKKLSNIFAEDNDAYLEALKRLEKVSGTDLLNDLTATEFANILPRRLGSVMMQAGALAGGIWYNPLVLAALPLFSPKLVGKATTTAGKISPFIKPTLENTIKAATSLIK